jgi:hypothetical protein
MELAYQPVDLADLMDVAEHTNRWYVPCIAVASEFETGLLSGPIAAPRDGMPHDGGGEELRS